MYAGAKQKITWTMAKEDISSELRCERDRYITRKSLVMDAWAYWVIAARYTQMKKMAKAANMPSFWRRTWGRGVIITP